MLKASEDNNNNTVMSYTDKGNLSHLGPFDVDAVQHLYGAPEAKAAAPVQWFQGPDRSMVIVANDQDNYILGSVARDTVYGGGGSDYIKTDAGDDYVIAGAGNDAVFGNGGADILYIGRLHSQAAITVSNVEEGEEVQGTVLTANDELDTFYGVETLDFINGSVATDPVQRRRASSTASTTPCSTARRTAWASPTGWTRSATAPPAWARSPPPSPPRRSSPHRYGGQEQHRNR